MDQQLCEAARETNFRLADVSRVIAPETLDLSNKSFLISGFEKFENRRRLRRVHELNRLVTDGKGPLRVDQISVGQNKVQTYVRIRSMREAFAEFWMSARERRNIEDAARAAIANTFDPYLQEHRKTEEDSRPGPPMQRGQGSGKPRDRDVDPVCALVKGLEDAVSRDAPSSKPEVNRGLGDNACRSGSGKRSETRSEEERDTASVSAFPSRSVSSASAEEEDYGQRGIDTIVMDPEGGKLSSVELLQIGKDNYAQRLEALKNLLLNTSAPLRLESGGDERDDKVLYLRERCWGEFSKKKSWAGSGGSNWRT
jgi:hypothetical protein